MKRILSFAAVLCAAILSVSCGNGIPDTKKGIMDAFVAGTRQHPVRRCRRSRGKIA